MLLLFVWDDLGILPEALRTKCARCSPQQLEGGLRVITKLYYDYPTQYARLRSKWDPNGEYHRRFEEYLRGLQFNTINSDPVSRKCGFLSVDFYHSVIILIHHSFPPPSLFSLSFSKKFLLAILFIYFIF